MLDFLTSNWWFGVALGVVAGALIAYLACKYTAQKSNSVQEKRVYSNDPAYLAQQTHQATMNEAPGSSSSQYKKPSLAVEGDDASIEDVAE